MATMNKAEMFAAIKAGKVTEEQFDIWVDNGRMAAREKGIEEGREAGFQSGVDAKNSILSH